MLAKLPEGGPSRRKGVFPWEARVPSRSCGQAELGLPIRKALSSHVGPESSDCPGVRRNQSHLFTAESRFVLTAGTDHQLIGTSWARSFPGSFAHLFCHCQVGTVSSSLPDKETEAQRGEVTRSGSPSWDRTEGCRGAVPDPGTAPTPGPPASLTVLHSCVLRHGRPGDADAVLLLQVQETPLSL